MNIGKSGHRIESRDQKAGLPGLSREKLLRMMRWMVTSREYDEAEIRLQRQQKVFFQISSSGHEAVNAASGLLLPPGIDWFYPYYRDRTLNIALGMTPYDMFLQAMGKRDDPGSGGRQMSSHWGNPRLHIVTQSSPTGTQYLQAVGSAEAGRIARAMPPCDDRPPASAYELVYVSGGEGSTSEGEFFEAISTASMRRLPVLFVIEDNQYAISVPVECQTPGASISKLLKAYPNLHVAEVNGLDPVASYRVLRRAVKYIRQGWGPALVHAHVVRLHAHSNSDDDRLYRPPHEREADESRDPIRGFEAFLIAERVSTPEELKDLRSQVQAEIAEAVRRAEAAPAPDPASAPQHLFSQEEVVTVETSPDPEAAAARVRVEGEGLPPLSPPRDDGAQGRPAPELTLVEMIN